MAVPSATAAAGASRESSSSGITASEDFQGLILVQDSPFAPVRAWFHNPRDLSKPATRQAGKGGSQRALDVHGSARTDRLAGPVVGRRRGVDGARQRPVAFDLAARP